MKASDVKVHIPSEEAARTWSGLGFGRVDLKNPNPVQLGFEVRGPSILIGTPEDNEIIKFAAEHGFLPYSVTPKTDAKKPAKKSAKQDAVRDARFPRPWSRIHRLAARRRELWRRFGHVDRIRRGGNRRGGWLVVRSGRRD